MGGKNIYPLMGISASRFEAHNYTDGGEWQASVRPEFDVNFRNVLSVFKNEVPIKAPVLSKMII